MTAPLRLYRPHVCDGNDVLTPDLIVTRLHVDGADVPVTRLTFSEPGSSANAVARIAASRGDIEAAAHVERAAGIVVSVAVSRAARRLGETRLNAETVAVETRA